MQNRNSSVRTTAQKCTKSRLLPRPAPILAILMLAAVSCQAQINDSTWKAPSDSRIKYSGSSLLGSFEYKDSCWWQPRTDTVNVDFVIMVDENGFVKKQRADFIIHSYEQKTCKGFGASVYTPNRNDTFLLNGKQIEVLLYRPKNQSVLLGNSR